MRFVKPLDTELLDELRMEHDLIITLEENVKSGGFGEQVLGYYTQQQSNIHIQMIALEDQFIPHGSVSDLMRQQKIDVDSVESRVKNWIKEYSTDGRQE